MKRMMRQYQLPPLSCCQPVFDQCQVQVLIRAVQFVADDRMSDMGQVNPNLMFSSGVRHNPEECERLNVLG